MVHHASQAYGCADLALSVVGSRRSEVNTHRFSQLGKVHNLLWQRLEKGRSLDSKDLATIGFTMYLLLSYAVQLPTQFLLSNFV